MLDHFTICVSPNCDDVLVLSKEYLSHCPRLCEQAGERRVPALGLARAQRSAVQALETQTGSGAALQCLPPPLPWGFLCGGVGGGTTGPGPKPPLPAGARLTARSPSLKAQSALASSPSERAIFVFHLQKLFPDKGDKSQKENQYNQCLQPRREQVTLSPRTRTAKHSPSGTGAGGQRPWVPHPVLHPPSLLCEIPLHTLHLPVRCHGY